MDIYTLSPDLAVDEYELGHSPGEHHIPLEWVNTPYWDSYVNSLNGTAIQGVRRELTPELLELENEIMVDFIMGYEKFIFTGFVADMHRFYDAYCFTQYRQEKKVYVEYSYFIKIIVEFFQLNNNGFNRFENVLPKTISSENLHEKDNDEPQELHLHVFDEEQMDLKVKMYRESVLARHFEHFYKTYGEIPILEEIEKTAQSKLERETLLLTRFFEAGRKESSLADRTYLHDFLFSFEQEQRFVFFYGKSIYRFRYDESNLYLNGEIVDLTLFFRSLVDEKKRVWKHVIRIGKLFERNGIEYTGYRRSKGLSIYRLVDERDTFVVRYNNAEMSICWDKRNFYRLTGEHIVEPSILVHEMIELDGQRNKAAMKAKQFFKTFLTKSEKQDLIKKKSVYIEAKEFDYIFCPGIQVNPIIRIDKQHKSKKALCVMLDNPHIPRYDVLASAMLLVKSGYENRLNNTVNEFELNDTHTAILDKY